MAHEPFEGWWPKCRERLDSERDPHEAARALQREIRGLDDDERRRSLDIVLEHLLVRRHAYGVCLFLLEGIADFEYLRDIARHLMPLPPLQNDDEEAHLADLIRILAASDEDELMAPVETYLLERDPGPPWSTVPWALWPRRKRLFARAWRRFFLHYESADWKNTLVVRSFLSEPQAIRLVRRELEPEAPERWEEFRSAILRQAGMTSWLTSKQLAALERATR